MTIKNFLVEWEKKLNEEADKATEVIKSTIEELTDVSMIYPKIRIGIYPLKDNEQYPDPYPVIFWSNKDKTLKYCMDVEILVDGEEEDVIDAKLLLQAGRELRIKASKKMASLLDMVRVQIDTHYKLIIEG